MGRRHNVYAEIGSSWAISFSQGPEAAAHFIGSLLRDIGSGHMIWGTDSIWWGSPQWQIDAFKALKIPEPMKLRYGYPALTDERKARILGLNAAELYGVVLDPETFAVDPSATKTLRAARRAAMEAKSACACL